MMFIISLNKTYSYLMKTDQNGSSFHSIKTQSEKNSSTSPQVSPERILGFKRIKSFGNPYLSASTTHASSKASITIFSKQPQQDSQEYNIQAYLNRGSQPIEKRQDKVKGICSNLRYSKQDGRDRQKVIDKYLWSNDFSLPCVVMYNGKAIQTICRVTATQLQFENAGCSFKLSKISKIKVLYEDYRKCIWFTCEENKGNKASEFKFKIYLENDMKDQLYVLFSKVIVQKLLILSYQIDLQLSDDSNVDRFILVGDILKRSQFFGNWAQRKLVVTDRIQSFKGDKCTFQMKNIKQIWTRFDVHDNKLVLKIRHGNEKTELAVPLVNYTIRFCKDNWLYRIYKLVCPSLN